MLQTIKERPAHAFGYSTILPAAWISISVVMNLLLPGHRLGVVGTALLYMGVASLIGWLFAKRHRRQFTKTEYWRIIAYCFLWALVLELFAIFAMIVLPQMEAGHVEIKPLAIAIPITITLNALFSWLAFRQGGRRAVDAYLRKTTTTRTQEF